MTKEKNPKKQDGRGLLNCRAGSRDTSEIQMHGSGLAKTQVPPSWGQLLRPLHWETSAEFPTQNDQRQEDDSILLLAPSR